MFSLLEFGSTIALAFQAQMTAGTNMGYTMVLPGCHRADVVKIAQTIAPCRGKFARTELIAMQVPSSWLEEQEISF